MWYQQDSFYDKMSNKRDDSVSVTVRVETDFTAWDARASNSNSVPANISNSKQQNSKEKEDWV